LPTSGSAFSLLGEITGNIGLSGNLIVDYVLVGY
jgi:hypothetical protein